MEDHRRKVSPASTGGQGNPAPRDVGSNASTRGYSSLQGAGSANMSSLPIGATDSAVDNLSDQLRLSIEITHVTTGKVVSFPAFLTEISDSYSSNWDEQPAYGRMDPLPTYQGTTRKITAAWVIPAFSEAEAERNLAKVALLEQFLYPSYASKAGGATTIKSAPLLRVKFANLIMNAKTGGGLLGYAAGFSTNPNLDQGVFISGDTITPKELSLSLDFTPLHEHELGWDGKGEFRGNLQNSGFPYGHSAGSATAPIQQSVPPEVQAANNDSVFNP